MLGRYNHARHHCIHRPHSAEWLCCFLCRYRSERRTLLQLYSVSFIVIVYVSSRILGFVAFGSIFQYLKSTHLLARSSKHVLYHYLYRRQTTKTIVAVAIVPVTADRRLPVMDFHTPFCFLSIYFPLTLLLRGIIIVIYPKVTFLGLEQGHHL